MKYYKYLTATVLVSALMVSATVSQSHAACRCSCHYSSPAFSCNMQRQQVSDVAECYKLTHGHGYCGGGLRLCLTTSTLPSGIPKPTKLI
jgi:hypothetical protein